MNIKRKIISVLIASTLCISGLASANWLWTDIVQDWVKAEAIIDRTISPNPTPATLVPALHSKAINHSHNEYNGMPEPEALALFGIGFLATLLTRRYLK
ncbi:MAG: PEP-CTERM sorting domain-containing protein [Methylophilaceae bacterium]|nr:PEP-CTERM sorting domain-containing protein [Methylophilaceae bacterium]